jgi:hypothetical protein
VTLPENHTDSQMSDGGGAATDGRAGQLDAAGHEHPQPRPHMNAPTRSLRVYVTDLNTRRSKVNVTIPISLINVGLKLGARLVPSGGTTTESILRSIEQGVTGRVFEMEDLEEGERIEIFVE